MGVFPAKLAEEGSQDSTLSRLFRRLAIKKSSALKENRFFKGLPKLGRGFIVGRMVNDVYRPPLLHKLLKPRVSGNSLNGRGEDRARRVGKIYHFIGEGPRGYPWFWVNLPFAIRTVNIKDLGYGALTKSMIDLADTTAVANKEPFNDGVKVEQRSPAEWAKLLKAKATELGADDVGICRVTDDMLYEGRPSPGKYALMIAAQMHYETAQHIPHVEGLQETMHAYIKANEVSMQLMKWLREKGVYCESGSSAPDKLLLVPAALKAGLGQLGKHGSLIHPKMGALVRFCYVSFDLDVEVDEPVEFGSDDFCLHCQVCTQHCPPQAITESKQMVRGVERWYVDFDKCVPYFNDTLGCGICISVCPFSRPGVGDNLVSKLATTKHRLREAATIASDREFH